jgi:hypothetical protein
MHLLAVLLTTICVLVCNVSGEEFKAFEFPKDPQRDIPKYFDDYGHPNTHTGHPVSTSPFEQPNTFVLAELFKSYTLTMQDLGITTWLAHGSLLSWHWGQKMFPWEADIDMHISLPDLQFLACYYNMTVYDFKFHDSPDGRNNEYLLDINPNFPERVVSRLDNNRIDARWVDISNGAYIDITALNLFEAHAQEKGRPLLWQTKDGHVYDDADVYPLQRTTFEGIEALVPNNAKKLTAKEYTEKSLTETVFHGHKFDDIEQQWIAMEVEDKARTSDTPPVLLPTLAAVSNNTLSAANLTRLAHRQL